MVEDAEGILIFDDTIQKKAWADVSDLKTRQIKRRSEKTKNELMREIFKACIHNALKFRFGLMASWFSAQENFEYMTNKGKHFIAALKGNRLMVVSEDARRNKRFVAVDVLEFA